MAFGQTYIEKHLYLKYHIAGAPSGLLRYIVIIPAICEPEIFATLESIYCNKPTKYDAEVYILVNWPENIQQELKEQNKILFSQLGDWCSSHSTEKRKFFAILAGDLPAKHAGVGLARKIVMDIAIERFNSINQPSGFILSLDADTLVPADYLFKIEVAVEQNINAQTLIFNFAHELEGSDFSPSVYQAIALYELHMRYYRQMLVSCGFPYSYYTIGSCFGIRADLYTKIGGMNRRKGAEDFYFLHKTFTHENVLFLPEIVLMPSSRPSWRVPFGTGPTVRRLIGNPVPGFYTYNPLSFDLLKIFFQTIAGWCSKDEKNTKELLQQVDPAIIEFISENSFVTKIIEINQHTSTPANFMKRFFQWFDGLMLLRFLNWHSEHGAPEVDLVSVVKQRLKLDKDISSIDLLKEMRKLEG